MQPALECSEHFKLADILLISVITIRLKPACLDDAIPCDIIDDVIYDVDKIQL